MPGGLVSFPCMLSWVAVLYKDGWISSWKDLTTWCLVWSGLYCRLWLIPVQNTVHDLELELSAAAQTADLTYNDSIVFYFLLIINSGLPLSELALYVPIPPLIVVPKEEVASPINSKLPFSEQTVWPWSWLTAQPQLQTSANHATLVQVSLGYIMNYRFLEPKTVPRSSSVYPATLPPAQGGVGENLLACSPTGE